MTPLSPAAFPLKAVGLSVSLALGLSLPLTAALAAGSENTIRNFAIGPGPLSQVLAQFAVSAGVPLSFDPALLGTRQSPGLQGSFSIDEGFARLLEGSGFERLDTGRGYTLVPKVSATVEF